MHKEVASVVCAVLLVGIGSFVFSVGTLSGALVNDAGELKVERIELYSDFPLSLGIYRPLTARAKQGILVGGHEDFYMPWGLRDGNNFFDNEEQTYTALLQLACREPVIIGRVEKPFPKNIEVDACDPALRVYAERALFLVSDLDYQLVAFTAKNSACGTLAETNLDSALLALHQQNYRAFLTELRTAWSISQCA